MKPKPIKSVLAYDFETFYDKDYSLSRMSTLDYIADKRFQPICLAIATPNEDPTVVMGDGSAAPKLMREALMDNGWEHSLVVAHHNRFDAGIARFRLKMPEPALYGCTRLMARVAVRPYTGRVSLKDVAGYYQLGEKGTQRETYVGRRLQDFSPRELADYMDYCADDAVLCLKALERMRHELPGSELVNIDLVLRMFLYPELRLNLDVLESRLTAVRQEKKDLVSNLPEGFTKESLMSQHQLAELLPKLGVDTPLKWSEKQQKMVPAMAKTDPGFRALLEHEDPTVQMVAAARMGIKSTIEETRLERMIGIAKRYRLLAVPLLYAGAHTYRYSGDEKLNLQNLPRGSALRTAIEAPPGHVLIAADYSQIEARICAALAKCTRLLTAFADPNRDPYCEAASDDYGRTITKADKVERFAGKTKILQLQYASGHLKLQGTLERGGLKVSEAQAKRMVHSYRNNYWEIPQLWKKLDKALELMAHKESFPLFDGIDVINGMLFLPNKMIMPYNELANRHGRFTYRYGSEWRDMYGGKLLENLVQALAGQIIREAMSRLYAKYGIRTLLQVHDELIVAEKTSEVTRTKQLIMQEMLVVPEWLPTLPLEIEFGVGPNYGACK